ncbi:T9SS type A sorting domain-containing protein [Winogradskyella sp. UBA3174]|uniref:T9SS type A sorting domain-containing protein n=1 Tax=Winogradskyella sp. UBA3174 TaxID=1947785 RepID=UPI0026015DDA|nr:T9SS type A sorting domain-containing protein [Winogradskyella sp. UBA3174]|tara:strand:+ start:5223 stop:6674 length:1452 start_codon:yes stop_codon:yes gene_type:complete
MKKITFLLCLLTVSLGFAQVNLEDFEDATVFTPANALGAANVTADPVDPTNMVGEVISSSAGDPWQQADLIMQDNLMDFTTDITVQVDVYSTESFKMLVRVDDLIFDPAAPSATADNDYVGGSGWQTLTFTLNEMLDGQSTANGEYNRISFFPNWAASGGNAANPIWNNGVDFTFFIDNITAVAGQALPIETCSDGIQNQDETGIDCGGVCAPCPASPAGPAPLPTSPDGETFSVYNGNLPGDVTTYSANWPFAYDFGAAPSELDLDAGADVNGAWQFDFAAGGYGQGEGPVDATSYNFVSFDYWAATPSEGTAGFRLEMFSNAGGPNLGFVYEIGPGAGDQEATVIEQWTKVVIPMTYFTGLGFSDANFFQWKFDPYTQSVDNKLFVYIDNFLLTQGNPLSVNNIDITEFRAFPNPTNGDWNISGTSVINTVAVFDILGKQVFALTPNATEVTIDASALNSGIYFARIDGENGSKTLKLIKQ